MTGTTQHTKEAKRILPPGWRWVRLGEVCVQDRALVDPKSEAALHLSYLGLENIESQTGRILKSAIGPAADEGISTTYAFDTRHVLYGKLRPYLNKVALPDFAGRCTTEVIPLLPKPELDKTYLCWLLRRTDTVAVAMRDVTGSRMPRADMSAILKHEIPLPPLPEQQRIAAILKEQMAAVDKARTAAEARLDAVKALPAAYLREVFPNTEGCLPQGWKHRLLSDLCEVRLGKMLSPAAKTGNRPVRYLRNANVQWNQFDLSDVFEMDFSEEQEQLFALKHGDVLVCEGGEPGRAAVWEGQIARCCYQKTLHRLRPLRGMVDSYFIMYRLWQGAINAEFTGSNTQTTIAHLPLVKMRALRLAVPPLDDQRRLAARLREQMAATEKARAAAETELDAINALPAALLRRAFNGGL